VPTSSPSSSTNVDWSAIPDDPDRDHEPTHITLRAANGKGPRASSGTTATVASSVSGTGGARHAGLEDRLDPDLEPGEQQQAGRQQPVHRLARGPDLAHTARVHLLSVSRVVGGRVALVDDPAPPPRGRAARADRVAGGTPNLTLVPDDQAPQRAYR
jgi:hypothetical protein